MAAEDERQLALANALTQIERQFGKGSIMRMGDFQERMGFEVVPTGSIALDLALGVGGLPRGRIVEIYGPESSGKTTLALHAIAEAQKTGGTAAFIDVEHALDPNYAAALGVDRGSQTSDCPARNPLCVQALIHEPPNRDRIGPY
jgi:recombination protein RecA